MAIAMQWVSQITTIALEMALPGLGGHWIDQKLGTGIVFTLLGVGLGMTLGGLQLAKIARSGQRPTRPEEPKQPTDKADKSNQRDSASH